MSCPEVSSPVSFRQHFFTLQYIVNMPVLFTLFSYLQDSGIYAKFLLEKKSGLCVKSKSNVAQPYSFWQEFFRISTVHRSMLSQLLFGYYFDKPPSIQEDKFVLHNNHYNPIDHLYLPLFFRFYGLYYNIYRIRY